MTSDDESLPGFRFHPTDEELVGFYLRRKVEKKPSKHEFIRHVDIYKYDPWDLPKTSLSKGDREWYFFCKRGKKYKNSIRPNRVTGSGFWKATGIDRPIYSSHGGGHEVIGLKKSLVYYCGSAGKGVKTEWMMHEFRLPNNPADAKSVTLEAEVWTLCRVLKKNASHRKALSEWKALSSSKNPGSNRVEASSSETCSIGSSDQVAYPKKGYITFDTWMPEQNKPIATTLLQPPVASWTAAPVGGEIAGDLWKLEDWEDLRSILNSATTTTTAAVINPFYH